MMPSNSNNRTCGFTLIELVVAMAIGLVVLWAILQVFMNQNRTHAVQQEVAYAQQNVRAAVDLMAREIRGAGYDPAQSGLVPIPAASASSIQVRSDLDGDGNTTSAGEDVTYSEVVDDNDAARRCLARSVSAGAPTRIVYNVVPNSLQFNYGFEDGGTGIPDETDMDATNDLGEVRWVGIQFQVHTANEDPGHTSGHDLNPAAAGTCRVRTLATRVRIRNVGFQDLE
jgi:type IV pilus assembly protein PilW